MNTTWENYAFTSKSALKVLHMLQESRNIIPQTFYCTHILNMHPTINFIHKGLSSLYCRNVTKPSAPAPVQYSEVVASKGNTFTIQQPPSQYADIDHVETERVIQVHVYESHPVFNASQILSPVFLFFFF